VRAGTNIKQQLHGHPIIVATVAELLTRRIPVDQILGDLRSFDRSGPGGNTAKIGVSARLVGESGVAMTA